MRVEPAEREFGATSPHYQRLRGRTAARKNAAAERERDVGVSDRGQSCRASELISLIRGRRRQRGREETNNSMDTSAAQRRKRVKDLHKRSNAHITYNGPSPLSDSFC